MSLIRKNQEKNIKLYSGLLDVNKNNNIINILQLFYDSFNHEYNSATVDWLDNQITFFLDPYGFDEKYKVERDLFSDELTNKLSDPEYKSVSLDKIVLELYSWTNKELEIFYKNNKENSTNKEKSVYNIGLRNKEKIKQSGGGMTNDYVLYYIKSLKNIEKFSKTKLIFNYLDKIIDEKELDSFIKNNLSNITELYIDNNIPYINIEKLFLYLLNSSNKYLDNIISTQKNYFIKFNLGSYENNSSTVADFNDKNWTHIKNKYLKRSHAFFKIFNNKLLSVFVHMSDNKYIKQIYFKLYDSNIIDESNHKKINIYFYFSILNNNDNKKYKINNKKTKKILLLGIRDFKNNFLKK